ncbi:MAG: hypothetical protein II961_09675 [Candidatus Riflebacteria bacterium]|jgi:hypothetical protein|nr:hypothetical protein [Candidatus Riflebacteria bacterium]
MRRLALGLGIAFFCFFCSGVSFASSIENDNLNSRIKALQERLKEFQNREYKDHEEKIIAEEEAIDLILDQDESLLPLPEVTIDEEIAEQIVEDLENRSDVAMTVLFHDSSEDERFESNKSFFASIDAPKVFEKFDAEKAVYSMIEPPKVIIEDSPEDKQQFYESLRIKVLQATRSSKLDQEEREQILASLN